MDSNQVTSIKPSMFKAYLSRNGWEKVPYKKKAITKYVLSTDKEFSILVPESHSTRDYIHSVEKALRILSQIEGRSKELVLKGILCPNQDELRFQFGGSSAIAGSLPLDYLISAAKAIQESIIYSACGEIQPKPFYQRKLKEAIDRSKRVRFGQTDIGSFIVSIELPFDPPVRNSLELQSSEGPFGRRVMSRLVGSVERAAKIAEDNEQIDLENEFKTGLNANIAESLAELSNDNLGIEVTVSCKWSDSLGVPHELTNAPVTLDSTTFSVLASIGRSLRGQSVSKDVRIIGFISGLSRDGNSDIDEEDDSNERTIIIRPDSSEGLPTKSVRVSLSANDYIRACDAHRDKKLISVKGKLEKLGKWQVKNYSDFKVL